jgi:hypothetical protein
LSSASAAAAIAASAPWRAGWSACASIN